MRPVYFLASVGAKQRDQLGFSKGKLAPESGLSLLPSSGAITFGPYRGQEREWRRS